MGTHQVFITGGSGYVGQRLIPLLVESGHSVGALVRPGSEEKLPPGCTPLFGNPLDKTTSVSQIALVKPCVLPIRERRDWRAEISIGRARFGQGFELCGDS